MKKIIAIIRNEKAEETKSALTKLGVHGFTFLHVTGKGLQKGMILPRLPGGDRYPYAGRHPLQQDAVPARWHPTSSQPAEKERAYGFQPQRMLIIVANDGDVIPVIKTLIAVNQTGRHGDGKIFVCPMVSAIRVRNGEQGDSALV